MGMIIKDKDDDDAGAPIIMTIIIRKMFCVMIWVEEVKNHLNWNEKKSNKN